MCVSCRLLKPRLQFSSCAAFAFTCPRTSWHAGVWETSRITSAHTCLIKASCSTQSHREKPSPSLLLKPSEAKWCIHLHLFPFKRFELMLGSHILLPSCSPLPDLQLIHPSLFFSPLKLPIFLLTSLCHFWIGSLIFYIYISLPHHSLSLIQFYLNLHEHWFWVGGCSLGAALVNSTGHWRNSLCCNKIETKTHRSSRWFSDGHAYPCFHKKGLLKIVMSVGFLEQLYTIFWPRNRCEWVFEIPVRAMKTRWTIFVKSHGVGITKYKLP